MDLVKEKQHRFFNTMWKERSTYTDDPLNFVIRLVRNTNNVLGRTINHFIVNDVISLSEVMSQVREGVRQSESSRRRTYVEINPTLEINYVYKEKHVIDEHHRVSFTQFRVSGHSLSCETGRWNRRGRGRLPLEQRLCVCGDIQTERHVTENCPVTQQIRNSYNFTRMETLFTDLFTPGESCKIINDILSMYK